MGTPKPIAAAKSPLNTTGRWLWLAGASAASAAGGTCAHATTITLINDFISTTGGNHLSSDFGGDGVSDALMTGFTRFIQSTKFPVRDLRDVIVGVDGNRLTAHYHSLLEGVWLNTPHKTFDKTTLAFSGPVSLTAGIPISFSGDPSINNGLLTSGMLEVTGIANYASLEIELDSFTYNDPPAVPDDCSSLALLAVGAGGLIVLRQRRKAA